MKATIEFPRGVFEGYSDRQVERLKRAMLNAAHNASMAANEEIRAAMQSSGLGTLGNAIGQYSDQKKGVFYRGGGSFSASGTVYVRSGSERSRGAIEAYTEGADIRPVKGQWLWIATDQIQRIVGRGKGKRRVTPALYQSMGLVQKVGPLVMVRRPNGYPMLIVNNVSVAASGKSRSARSLRKDGKPRRGQIGGVSIIAFIGIPFTSRASRVDVRSIVRKHADSVGNLINQELQKGS